MARQRRALLRKRTDGLYEYRVVQDGVLRSFYSRDPAAAVEKAKQPRPSRDGLHDFLRSWPEARRKDGIKPRTYRAYVTTVTHSLIPHLPDIKVSALTADHIEALRTELPSAAAFRNAKVVLGTALEYAMEKGIITTNPARAKSLRQKVVRREWVLLNRDETMRLLDAAREEPYEALYVIAAVLGLRQGEILGLRWRDVDLDKGLLHIRHTVGRDYDGVVKLLPPKTKNAARTIHLPDVVIDALRRIPPEERQLPSVGNDHADLLFKSSEGELLDGSTVTRYWFARVLERAGLPPMRFHDLRHSAVTAMLEDGVSARAVADIVGHSDVATTLSLYASTTRGMHDKALAAMNARYGR